MKRLPSRPRYNRGLATTHGYELSEIRKSRGITQAFVAGKMDITAGYLSDLEQGNRRWSKKLINAYRRAISR